MALIYDLSKASSYWKILITNNYSKRIGSIYLESTLSGLYSLDGGKNFNKFLGEIDLGDLKPGDESVILIYANQQGYDSLLKDTIKITYEGGVKYISFPYLVGKFFYKFDSLLAIMFIWILFIWGGTLFFNRHNKSPISTP